VVVSACSVVSWVRKGVVRLVTSVECRRAALGKDPSRARDGASGARASVGDRSPMGSRSEEGTETPSQLL